MVFRIEKTCNSTVMSNHHLRNAGLSLKPKGPLSMLLSMPEDWNYTTGGLTRIRKEGTDNIGSTLEGTGTGRVHSPQLPAWQQVQDLDD